MKCAAKTKAGKRCKRNAVAGTERCSQHAEPGLTVDEIFERYEVPPDCQPLLDAYVQLHDRRALASMVADREGLYIETENGVFTNPAVSIERQTAAELARLHREIVRSSKPIEPKAKNSQLDELTARREARRAGPAAAKT